MKERPIPFNTEMVKAILEGRKTQTRRAIKPQLEDYRDGYPDGYDCPPSSMVKYKGKWIDDSDFINDFCPYGQVGDSLWVRRTKDGKFIWKKALTEIWLEITEIRVERLQEITPEDCLAEGIPFTGEGNEREALERFIELWNSLNAKRGYPFSSNCWVWVISFKPVKEGKDENQM